MKQEQHLSKNSKREIIIVDDRSDKKDNPKVTILENKTVIVEGIGRAEPVGELDVIKFIKIAMSLPSFWK